MKEFNENHSGSGNGLISLILLVIIGLLVYQIYRMESIFELLTQEGIEVTAPVGENSIPTSEKGIEKAVPVSENSIEKSVPASEKEESPKTKKTLTPGSQKSKATGNKVQEQSKPAPTANQARPQRLTKDQISVSVKAKVENRYLSNRPDIPIKKDGITGKVTLNITVTRFGEVTKVSLNPASTIKDEDIIDSCKECALKTSLSSNYDCPDRQTGTITYTFAPYNA